MLSEPSRLPLQVDGQQQGTDEAGRQQQQEREDFVLSLLQQQPAAAAAAARVAGAEPAADRAAAGSSSSTSTQGQRHQQQQQRHPHQQRHQQQQELPNMDGEEEVEDWELHASPQEALDDFGTGVQQATAAAAAEAAAGQQQDRQAVLSAAEQRISAQLQEEHARWLGSREGREMQEVGRWWGWLQEAASSVPDAMQSAAGPRPAPAASALLLA